MNIRCRKTKDKPGRSPAAIAMRRPYQSIIFGSKGAMIGRTLNLGVPNMLKISAVVWFGVVLAISCGAQERFESGELKGFTKSPTEHIINYLDQAVTVSRV